jgi:hypothetical protein
VGIRANLLDGLSPYVAAQAQHVQYWTLRKPRLSAGLLRFNKAASESHKEIGYSPGFSSTFGSWQLSASREGVGFLSSASRIARLRRFRASSRADPFAKNLEIFMACSVVG